MTDNPETIYDPEYIKSLFDKMSKTYGLANYISSALTRSATSSIYLLKPAENHYVYLVNA